MLIEVLDDTVQAACLGTMRDRHVQAVENLLRAHREGRHIVCVGHRAARTLSERTELSTVATGTATRLVSTASELLGLKREIDSRIVVEFNLPDPAPSTVDPGVMRTGLEWWAESHRSHEVTLLVENLADGRFYIPLAEGRMYNRKLGYRVAIHPQGGGGSTIGAELTEIGRRGEPCVCVLDSDRSRPAGPLGDTARHAEADHRRNCSWLQRLVVLRAREAENLVPVRLISDAMASKCPGQYGPAIARRQHVEGAINDEWLLHVDMKAGLTRQEIHRMASGDAETHQYWQAVAASLTAASRLQPCSNGNACDTCGACSHVLIDGFGGNMLDHVRGFLQPTSACKCGEYLVSESPEELLEILDVLCEWCCAPRPFRT